MAIKFERKDARTTVAFIDCQNETTYGKRFKSLVAVRAIKERTGWRVDRADAVAGAWMPWEPITSQPFRTLAAAKAEIRKFGRACKRPPGSPERKEYGLGRARRRR